MTVSTSHPPCSHLKTGKKLNENNSVSTSSTSNEEIDWRGVKHINSPIWPTIGAEVDTVDTVATRQGRANPSVRGGLVALNEDATARIGEHHQRARLTDAQVEAIRDAYEEHEPGHPLHKGYRILAKEYDVSKRTIRDIVAYRYRNQWATKLTVPRAVRRAQRKREG